MSSRPSSFKSIIKSIDHDFQATSFSSILYEDTLELILLSTVNEEPSAPYVYLAELASTYPDTWNQSQVDQALFERLRMPDSSLHLAVPSRANKSAISQDIITENRCLYYLSGCYQRLSQQQKHFKLIFDEIQKLFLDHSKTAITLPDIYDRQNLARQLLELLMESLSNSLLCEYIDRVTTELVSSMTDEINSFFENVFRYMYQAIQPLNYFSNELISYIEILTHLSRWPTLVRIIFRISHPKTSSKRSSRNSRTPSEGGRAFEDTLIGSLLSKSCLPSSPDKPYVFFDKPKTMNEHDIEYTTSTMWQALKIHQENLTRLFKAFVQNADVRTVVLQWIGDCLIENQEKNKEWTSHDPLTALLFVSDGFCLNLNLILLNLARPFAEPYSPKLLKINSLYGITTNEHVHLKDLHRVTPLVPRTENAKHPDSTFNFITEIFFMAHFSYSCSIKTLHRILSKTYQEIAQIQEAYEKSGTDNENSQRLSDARNKSMTIYLNIKAVLTEPHLLDLSNALFSSTCTWLVHLALSSSNQSDEKEQIRVIEKLPLRSRSNERLSYLPELIVENIISYLKGLSRLKSEFLQSMDSSINEYINLILVFMGDATRLHNPHLRAKLAAVLDIISSRNNNRPMTSAFADSIFNDHPFIEHLSRVLLDVFTSIELTGQAVAFELKFNYRRPMYEVLEYLWKFDRHRTQMKKLALSAERHIDDAEAPLFLRFINLLMNDANFLLDEALRYMTKLKEHQETKEREEWNAMSEEQRAELEKTCQRDGQMARYTNIMGSKTLTILDMITQDIQSIFCHPAICERLATMLNYFFQHLVGPKRRNLKVRDMKEYQFDPSELVAKVTNIYLNLARYDRFCAAIATDGMSYNEQLFPQAIEVLQRIQYSSERMGTFIKLSQHVKEIAARERKANIVYDDAPDAYLDPITSTLMNDPVMLPSSRQIVDRSTIARHLLSDQTDPFNRNSLRMQDVIPQSSLKRAIEQWKVSRRA